MYVLLADNHKSLVDRLRYHFVYYLPAYVCYETLIVYIFSVWETEDYIKGDCKVVPKFPLDVGGIWK